MRLLLTALALVVTAAACNDAPEQGTPRPTPSAAPATTAPAPEPVDPLTPRPGLETPAPIGQPACPAASLSVTDADLLADEKALQEVFAVRTSSTACQLRGWPVVTLLDAGGSPIELTARRVGTATAVTLTRGTSVSFVLGTPRTSSCEEAGTLLVRLPGTDRTIRTATSMQVCDRRLEIGPVERRQDDEGAEH